MTSDPTRIHVDARDGTLYRIRLTRPDPGRAALLTFTRLSDRCGFVVRARLGVPVMTGSDREFQRVLEFAQRRDRTEVPNGSLIWFTPEEISYHVCICPWEHGIHSGYLGVDRRLNAVVFTRIAGTRTWRGDIALLDLENRAT